MDSSSEVNNAAEPSTQATVLPTRTVSSCADATPAEPRDVIILDPTGDLVLVIGSETDTQRFHVSRNAMALASHPWSIMLHRSGSFKEASAGTVSFPDDDVNAFMILLKIAHLRFHEVPLSLEYDQLLDIAILSDKYDTGRLCLPFYPLWVRYLHPLEDEHELSAEWCFISSTFRDHVIFSHMAERLILSARIGPEGRLVTPGGEQISRLSPMDTGIARFTLLWQSSDTVIGWVERGRLKIIDDILKLLNIAYESLLGRDKDCWCMGQRICLLPHLDDRKISAERTWLCQKGNEDSSICRTMQLGSYVSELERLGLPSRNHDSSQIHLIHDSIIELCEELSSMRFETLRKHKSCRRRMKISEEIYAIIRGRTSEITREYFDTRSLSNLEDPVFDKYDAAFARVGFLRSDFEDPPPSTDEVSKIDEADNRDTAGSSSNDLSGNFEAGEHVPSRAEAEGEESNDDGSWSDSDSGSENNASAHSSEDEDWVRDNEKQTDDSGDEGIWCE